MFYEERANVCCALPELQVHRAPRSLKIEAWISNIGFFEKFQALLQITKYIEFSIQNVLFKQSYSAAGTALPQTYFQNLLWLWDPYWSFRRR